MEREAQEFTATVSSPGWSVTTKASAYGDAEALAELFWTVTQMTEVYHGGQDQVLALLVLAWAESWGTENPGERHTALWAAAKEFLPK